MKKYLYELMTDQRKDYLSFGIKIILVILSFFYWMGIKIILWMYRSGVLKTKRLPKSVISVGNITLGGVGKTPLVRLIAKMFQRHGLKSAILTRGYMAKGMVSDEAEMLKTQLKDVPVLVGANRYQVAQNFLETNTTDVFILDDGFQHWRLFRNFNIVAIDATRPFGNFFLIPRGILREPMDSLKRADIFVLTKTDLGKENLKTIYQKIKQFQPTAAIVETIHSPVSLVNINNYGDKRNLFDLAGNSVCLFSGIGDPRSFEESAKSLKIAIKKHFIFMDHHKYSKDDIERIVHYCRAHNIKTIITTQKDAARLKELLYLFLRELDVFILEVEMKILKGEQDLEKRIFYFLDH
ncbi:MAG: tetraacyldisaccharide 4'-kinase [Candidatus Omnitrophica bacterium]|nr:tetraacyldisaccharide 4'-kinase [Candidatus Omnitrophota bacterium]